MRNRTGFNNMMLGNSRTADKFVVRMPDGMREALKEAARVSNTSLNTEIIARLQNSFTEDNAVNWTPVEGMLVRHNKDIAVIRGFAVNDQGSPTANIEVLGWSTFFVLISDLKPYVA